MGKKKNQNFFTLDKIKYEIIYDKYKKEVKKGNTQKNIKDYFSQKNEENEKNLNQKK